jgi:ribosomal protein S4
MRTRQFKKFNHNLLNQKIPENLLPASGLSCKKGAPLKKSKTIRKYGSKLKNQLYKSFAVPLIENQQKLTNDLMPAAIYSIDQINLELKKNKIQKYSDFGYQLQERKKLRWFYGGISTRSLRKIFKESYSKDLTLASSIFQNLEKRLDVVLYRSGFFGSIYEARQWVLNKRIYINNRSIIRPSYQIQPGDMVEIDKKWHELLTQNILERFLLFFKNMQLMENVNGGNYPNIRNIQLKNPLGYFQLDNITKFSEKEILNKIETLATLQTSRKFQKILTNSKIFKAFNIMKATHLEVSYKTLSFIYLYPPQKIVFPTLLNVSAIDKSF